MTENLYCPSCQAWRGHGADGRCAACLAPNPAYGRGPLPPHLATPGTPGPLASTSSAAAPSNRDSLHPTHPTRPRPAARPPAWMQALAPLALLAVVGGALIAIVMRNQADVPPPNSPSKSPVAKEKMATSFDAHSQGNGTREWSRAPGQRLNEVDVSIERLKVVDQLRAMDDNGQLTTIDMKAVVIDLKIRNGGSGTVDYASWQTEQNAELYDGQRRLPLWQSDGYAKVELHAEMASTQLDDGSVTRDSVIFRIREPFVEKRLKLALPASNVGGEGAFRFDLPRD